MARTFMANNGCGALVATLCQDPALKLGRACVRACVRTYMHACMYVYICIVFLFFY